MTNIKEFLEINSRLREPLDALEREVLSSIPQGAIRFDIYEDPESGDFSVVILLKVDGALRKKAREILSRAYSARYDEFLSTGISVTTTVVS